MSVNLNKSTGTLVKGSFKSSFSSKVHWPRQTSRRMGYGHSCDPQISHSHFKDSSWHSSGRGQWT
jgi:hypothetical protein